MLAFVEPTALFAHLTAVALTERVKSFTVSLSPALAALVTLSTLSRVYSKVISDVNGATPSLFTTPAP